MHVGNIHYDGETIDSLLHWRDRESEGKMVELFALRHSNELHKNVVRLSPVDSFKIFFFQSQMFNSFQDKLIKIKSINSKAKIRGSNFQT